jgi:mannosyltransferase OCH1-like enzyme
MLLIFYYSVLDIRAGIVVIISVIIYFHSSAFQSITELDGPKKEGMTIDIVYERDYDIEEKMKSAVIPFNIFQTWCDKKLPPKMRECVDRLKSQNPEFTHHLYDDNDCRNFIKTNFDSDVLESYDTLIPGAYKADLWRYCVLYKYGGIYLDIKYKCENGFKLIELTDKEYFVLDRPYMNNNISLSDELKLINNPNYYKNIYNSIDSVMWKNKEIGLYNAVMVCKPNNPILLDCINEIVFNVNNKSYDFGLLYPTGPGLLGEKYFKHDYSKIKNIELFYSIEGTAILNKKRIIMSHYPEYRREQHLYGNKIPHYGTLWRNKNIYKTNSIINMFSF